MNRAIPLMLAIAWHLPVHAGDLPRKLTGAWGTAESLYAGTTAQNILQLEPDGFGILVGSTPPAKRLNGVDDDKPLPRAIIGFPVRAALDGDTLTLGAYWPGKIDEAQAARMRLTCRYDKAAPALICTGPDKVARTMRRLSDTVEADAAKMIAAVRAQAAQSGSVAVHSQAALDAILAAGQPTPLDALMPYGKRRFLRSLHWGERSPSGFSTAPLTRELTLEQLKAVLHFVASDEYLPMLAKGLAGPPLRLPAPSAEVERRLDQLEQFIHEDSQRRANAGAAGSTQDDQAVLLRYRELFGERMDAAALKRQPPGDLLPLFDAAALAAFASPDSPAFADLLLVHAELALRGIDTRRTLDDSLLHAMLAARRFEQAQAFAATRPHLAHRSVPRVVDTLAPGFQVRSEFRYDAANKTLTRVASPPPAGTELLMVVGSGCHFSANALDTIAGDAELKARLREAGLILVVPPRSPIPLDYIADWNAAHPDLPIRIPAYAREWQAMDVLGTPEFYLLKNGKVIAKRSGWPEEGNRTALLELIEMGRRQQ